MNGLNSLPVFLSASVPENLARTNRAQNQHDLLVNLANGILSNSGVLVFGGHPSVTRIIHKIIRLSDRNPAQIRLFQLNRYRRDVPEEVQKEFKNIAWFGSFEDDRKTIADDLAEMRDAMMKISRAAIFVGGKTKDYVGDKPGIRDEYERFLKFHANGPAYLIGMLEGEALNIINDPSESARKNQLNSLQEAERDVIENSSNDDLIASIILRDLQRRRDR